MRYVFGRIKDALLALSNTERSVYENASGTAQRTRVALGLAVLMAPLVSGFAMGHLAHVATGSMVAAGVLGAWWGVVVGVLEFMISGSTGGGRAALLRAAVAALVGVFTATPVMLVTFDERIAQRMEAEARARRQAQTAAAQDAQGLPQLQARIDALRQQRRAARREAARARRIQECELTGVKSEDLPCTGTRGEGPVYENAVRSEERARRRAAQVDGALERLRARRRALRSEIDRGRPQEPKVLQDPLAQVETLGAIVADSWAAALFCTVLFLLTVGLELMVAFIKLTREEDDYDAAFGDYIERKKKIDARRMARLEKERTAEIEANPRFPDGPSFTESMKARPQKLTLGEALRQRRRARQQRRAAREETTEEERRARRNGRPATP